MRSRWTMLTVMTLLGLGALLGTALSAQADPPAVQECGAFRVNRHDLKNNDWQAWRGEGLEPTALPAGWSAVGGNGNDAGFFVIACRGVSR